METTFKAGVIGCGGRGRSHARGYQASPDVDIVACSDPVEDARNDFAEQFEVPNTYENYQEMLDTESLDFVSVCTWIELHKDMVIAAPPTAEFEPSIVRNPWHPPGVMPKRFIKPVLIIMW